MRKFIVLAVLALISSTAAEAKVHEFKFGGRVVRFDVPKNCKKISCIKSNLKEKAGKADKDETVSAAPAAVAVAAPAAAAVAAETVKAVPAPAAQPAPAPAPQANTQPEERKPLARLSLPTTTDEPKPVARATEPEAEPVKPSEPTPVGVWSTEKNEGKVRIVECGNALCGHTDGKPNEKVLINMQPGGKNRWNGKIHDVRSDSTYTSHMSLKNPNALRVEGCAFGGLFCGGQTWTRVQ